MSEIDRIQDEISVIEDDIEERKRSKAESDGAIKTYMKQLKETYDINSYGAITKFISDGIKESEKIKADILKMYERIMNEYNKATGKN